MSVSPMKYCSSSKDVISSIIPKAVPKSVCDGFLTSLSSPSSLVSQLATTQMALTARVCEGDVWSVAPFHRQCEVHVGDSVRPCINIGELNLLEELPCREVVTVDATSMGRRISSPLVPAITSLSGEKTARMKHATNRPHLLR